MLTLKYSKIFYQSPLSQIPIISSMVAYYHDSGLFTHLPSSFRRGGDFLLTIFISLPALTCITASHSMSRPEIPQTFSIQHRNRMDTRFHPLPHAFTGSHVAGFRHLQAQPTNSQTTGYLRLFSLARSRNLARANRSNVHAPPQCHEIIQTTRFFHERIRTGDKLQAGN